MPDRDELTRGSTREAAIIGRSGKVHAVGVGWGTFTACGLPVTIVLGPSPREVTCGNCLRHQNGWRDLAWDSADA